MADNDIIAGALKQSVLFRNCDDAFLSDLAGNSAVKTTEKGQLLYVSGDDADRFYIILDGWVKLFRETYDGTQAVVDILPAGHIFGETSIFEDDCYVNSAEAVEAGKVISLPLAMLKSHINDNPVFAREMLKSMARYRKQQDQELEHRTIQNASQRIGCVLLRLADQAETGEIKIQLPYDKTLVASRLGMQPETFSRALSRLKNETDIVVKGATIEVDDLDRLVDYSCSACSSEFPCKDIFK